MNSTNIVFATPELVNQILSYNDLLSTLPDCMVVNSLFFQEARRHLWRIVDLETLNYVETNDRRQLYAGIIYRLKVHVPFGARGIPDSDLQCDPCYDALCSFSNLSFGSLREVFVDAWYILGGYPASPSEYVQYYQVTDLPIWNSSLDTVSIELPQVFTCVHEINYILSRCSGLKSLTYVGYHPDISELIQQHLPALSKLEQLCIGPTIDTESNHQQQQLVDTIGKCEYLTDLKLPELNCDFYIESMARNPRSFSNLEKLSCISVLTYTQVRFLTQFTNLTQLELETWDYHASMVCTQLPRYMKLLKHLSMKFKNVTHVSSVDLLQLKELCHMERFKLSADEAFAGFFLGDEHIKTLTSKWKGLIGLVIYGGVRRCTGHMLFELSQNCPKLQEICIDRPKVGINVATLLDWVDFPLFPDMENLEIELFNSDSSQCLNEFYRRHTPKIYYSNRFKRKCTGPCCATSHASP